MSAAVPNVVERLRQICLALPETHEEVTWGSDLNFTVRGKIFCFPGETAMTVKVPKDALIGLWMTRGSHSRLMSAGSAG